MLRLPTASSNVTDKSTHCACDLLVNIKGIHMDLIADVCIAALIIVVLATIWHMFN